MKYTKLREVFPGDSIDEKLSKSFGIYKNKAYVHGTLCRVRDHLFILSKTTRYTPFIDDLVIGKIVYVSSDYYRVDLYSTVAILPSLSFTNASKRNKPDLKMGDYVFCRVVRVGLEPLLSCVGEDFGKLNGYVLPLEVWKAQLLYAGSTLFEIGQTIKFKGCVGINGFISMEGDNAGVVRDVYNEIVARLN